VEQGATQTRLQPGAASSASTTDQSEEQVCKDCFQLGTFWVLGKFYFQWLMNRGQINLTGPRRNRTKRRYW
jgi:hypothetical protein